MSHDIAKQVLREADSPQKREEAIRRAMRLGMPLHEIETYLDWLDSSRDDQPSPGALPPSAG